MAEYESLLTIALEFAKLGLSVFPLGSLSKIPLKNTNGFKDATTNEEIIFNWFTNEPYVNIGISLVGTPYFVLDIDDHDGKQSGMKSLMDLSNGSPLPDDVTAIRTPNNGTHLYFEAPAGIEIKQQIGFKTGLDCIKNFVVAPKSRVKRKDGTIGTYEVINGSLDSIKEVPAWLLEAITSKRQPSQSNTAFKLDFDNLNKPKTYYTAKFMTELMNGTTTGSRNSWITQQYGRMISLGMSYTVAYEWIRLVNEQFLDNPISDSELNKIVLSITKREQQKHYQTERSD